MSHNKVLCTVFFVCIIEVKMSLTYIIPVGGIFEGPSENEKLAFEVAVDIINTQRHLTRHTLKPLLVHIEPDDVINAKKGFLIDVSWDKPIAALETACFVLKEGVVSIFNLLSESNSNTIQSLCDAKEIPVIQTMLDTEHERECCSINLFPHAPVLAKAFADVVKQWKWKSFTIVYEKQQSIHKIAEILKFYDIENNNNVVIRQLLKENGDYIKVLKDIRRSGQTNFVLDCSTENLNEILKQAQQVGLMMSDYNYIVLNLDLHTFDLSPYQHSQTNITGFRLVDPLNSDVIEMAEAMIIKREKLGLENEVFSSHLAAWKMQTETALLVDAIMLFAEVLRDHGYFKAKPLFCNSSDSWEHGSTVFNFMKTFDVETEVATTKTITPSPAKSFSLIEITRTVFGRIDNQKKTLDGLSGKIEFDHHGFRTNFSLDIIELTEGGIINIGSWNTTKGLVMSRIYPEAVQPENSLINMTFNVAVCWVEPYTMLKNTRDSLTGNDQYEGFAIDLIREIAQLEGFNYKFIRSQNDSNGSYNSTTKQWTGMMRDVLDGTVDLAIGDLTITRGREQFVDFTSPFMSLGVQILYKKPRKAIPGFFSFAQPFAPEVWLLIGVTFCVLSLSFYVTARLSDAEWYNPYPCLERPRYFTTQFGLLNCFWKTAANLLQQDTEVAPRGIPLRTLARFWGFFILIMLSTYTANMAAFLTAEKDEWPFTNINELVKRAKKLNIKYGAVTNGATHKLFQESQNELFQKVSAYMDAHPEDMVSHYEDGVDRAAIDTNNYAFFMESSSIKYKTERICNLTAVGDLLDEKYYGIAMRKDATYRHRLSTAVLHLTQSGIIADLERKWWQKERGGGECQKSQTSSAPPLNYHHISGVLWITLGGTAIACLLVFIELGVHVFKKFKSKQQRIDEMKKELTFYFKFEQDVKPVENRSTLEDVNKETAFSKEG